MGRLQALRILVRADDLCGRKRYRRGIQPGAFVVNDVVAHHMQTFCIQKNKAGNPQNNIGDHKFQRK